MVDKYGEICLLFEFAADDVRKDLEFTMAVRSEACMRLDTVFVQDAKTAKALVIDVIVTVT